MNRTPSPRLMKQADAVRALPALRKPKTAPAPPAGLADRLTDMRARGAFSRSSRPGAARR